MKCPKCNNEMKIWYSEDGYANAWKCPKCNYICENQESVNDKNRFMQLLESLDVEYVTGVEKHEFYNGDHLSLIVYMKPNDICICNKYYGEEGNTPLNCQNNIVIKFDDDGKFLGFVPWIAEEGNL